MISTSPSYVPASSGVCTSLLPTKVGVGGGPSERIPTYPEAKTPERLPVSRDAHVVAHDEKSSAVRMPTAGFR